MLDEAREERWPFVIMTLTRDDLLYTPMLCGLLQSAFSKIGKLLGRQDNSFTFPYFVLQ